MSKKKLKIWCYDTESDTKYELYEQLLDPDYDSGDRIIDGKTYAENGLDVLYFTDNYNEPRRLRCEISGYESNYLDDYDLSLTRQGGKGYVRLDEDDVISTGGSLLSGTYQFAFRFVNPTISKVSKWSALSNPIHIYSQEYPENAYYNSGYGLATNRKITVRAEAPLEELLAFQGQYVQFAVVENIAPNPTSTALYASLLPMQTSSVLEYKSNYKIGTIPIEDLVVDYATLETAKTLTIVRNRMFLGNIKYRNLEFDGNSAINGGKPYVSSGYIKSKDLNALNILDLEKYASMYKGYFRDEVYRFGIVYFDKYGNRSQVHTLDMTNVAGNAISSGTDMKFPARSEIGYALLTNTSLMRWLGLNINITNHPTWATGFEIVREERIKRILFQSPSIPMASIKGIGALEAYPSTGYIYDTTTSEQNYVDAQPQTSDIVMIPKNLAWPELRNIIQSVAAGGTDPNKKIKGEAAYDRAYNYTYVCLFPQENLYENKGYEFKGYEKLETVDCVFTSVNAKSYNYVVSSSLVEASYNFYGMSDIRYFYNDTVTTSNDILNEKSSVQDAIYVDNYSSGSTLAGAKIETYEDLQTFGVPLGYKPNVQRKLVCKLNSPFADEGAANIPFSIGNHNAFYPGSGIYASSPFPAYYNSAGFGDPNVLNAIGFGDTPVQVIRIVNVVNENIGDDRYGSTDSQRKFISTGSSYFFEAEDIEKIKKKISVSVNLDVFGGDCFVTSHVFKVSDSTYLLSNGIKFSGTGSGYNAATVAKNFDVSYKIGSSESCISMPVAAKGLAQFVQVILESEYNGQAMDTDVLNIKSTYITPFIDGTTYVLNLEGTNASKASVKTCLTYNTNANLKFDNEPKVYFPKLQYSFVQNEFQSRIQYSDIKIYNSSELGFDIFRVLNFYDMEESGGGITKLALASDNMYAIQTKRISYVPSGERLLEAADNGILAVGSSNVIGKPSIIDERRGSQHLAGIVETGSIIMIPDNINQAVYMLAGQQLTIISDKDTASLFRDKLGIVFVEKNIRSVWDPLRKEYWLIGKDQDYFCYVFNASIEQWVTNYEFSQDAILYGGKFTNQRMWVLGKADSNIYTSTIYTGEHTKLFGSDVTPRVTFIVNPDADYAKTFDDIAVAATERLQNMDFRVEREQSMGRQLVEEVNLDVFPVEGNYRIKTLRDLRMVTTMRWFSNDIPSSVSSVYTKYRLSARRPF
jgi:hypothetical protein